MEKSICKQKPAIVTVGYSRAYDLLRLLNSIEQAEYDSNDIPLVISLDKAPNEQEVVKVAEDFVWTHGEKIIRTFETRQGLRKHVLQCGDLSEKYGAVIILEDDLIVSPGFYKYVQQALERYHDEPCITGVSVYSHEWNGYARKNFYPMADKFDTYLGQYSISWGQCWTEKWWKPFREWYAKCEDKLPYSYDVPYHINYWSDKSWGKYFANYIVEKNLFYVVPRYSFSTNCSDVGEHVKTPDNVHQVRLMLGAKDTYYFPNVDEAMKYDIFFESMDLKQYLKEYIGNDDVCINLADLKREKIKQRYILTPGSLPYKVIRTWGLMMRPAEMNIIYNIPGEEIKLYDTSVPDKKPKDCHFQIMRFEVKGFSVKSLGKYYSALLGQSIALHSSRLFKKK